MLGVPNFTSTKSTNSSIEQPSVDTQVNPSTPSDKSMESPQDIKSLILTMVKKDSSLTEKLNTPSKHYTSEWLASQKPEEAPTGKLPPWNLTLVNKHFSEELSKNPTGTTGETSMIGKLSEAMGKLIQKQGDTTSK